MKIKTIVTGCNRKQARSIALEQEARAKREETKNKIANKLLNDTKEQLIAKSKDLIVVVDKSIELAKEIADLTQTNESLDKENASLKNKLKLRELTISCREEEIDKLKLNINTLQQALKEADKDIALASRPLWKKVLGKC
ncbi:hypothetical protein [Cellulosilyticum lentocellum]|uniref:Uncharacterized protein n=1 Tax=Cellulosilyticum lentocellum (strain ATCC 49066 / DSM 5427 / NCIMB 11756 / RHM5) TaxID=642492 RepID=F2JNA2_CELLD|nr:hypothetical protein [Cellulosilyticum lentocellum]ADZ83556.1 hypothetical protein Clole_1833 [Cellulosilyticum lentocellum DSM 5427]